MIPESIRRATRTVYGISLYRGFLNFALLIAAFNAFPGNRAVIALAILAFNQGFAAVSAGQHLIAASQNHLDNMAERKTRHAILLANEDWSGPSFWAECDRRVAEELPEQPPSSSRWAQMGLVILNAGARFLGDLVTVLIALAVAS